MISYVSQPQALLAYLHYQKMFLHHPRGENYRLKSVPGD